MRSKNRSGWERVTARSQGSRRSPVRLGKVRLGLDHDPNPNLTLPSWLTVDYQRPNWRLPCDLARSFFLHHIFGDPGDPAVQLLHAL